MASETQLRALRGERLDGRNTAENILLRVIAHALGAEPTDVSIEEFDAVGADSDESKRYAGLAAAHAAMNSMVDWRLDAAQRWVERAVALAPESSEANLAALRLSLLRGVQDDDAVERARHWESQARKRQEPHCVVEAATLECLAHEAVGDLRSALLAARRASRMAGTEGLPLSEFVSNFYLARQRRLAGEPHLASRILLPLRAAAPATWHRSVGWELWFAGAPERGDDEPWTALLASEEMTRPTPCRRDLADLKAVVQTDSLASLSQAKRSLCEWIEGRSADLPFGLHALSIDAEATAYVAIYDGTSRRVLGIAERILAWRRLSVEHGQPSRIDTLLCVLALAGERGLETSELFRRVYDFPFVQTTHHGSLHTLVHRAKKRLGDAAQLVHSEGAYRLMYDAPLLIPDPRCQTPVFDRALRLIASSDGGLTAQELAQALSVPLRTAQGVLRELAEAESCTKNRRGNHVTYVVEDTTFSQVHSVS